MAKAILQLRVHQLTLLTVARLVTRQVNLLEQRKDTGAARMEKTRVCSICGECKRGKAK